jgi:hypothetical protein
MEPKFGRTDFGRTDFGRIDFGRTDFGRTWSELDFGRTGLLINVFYQIPFY